MGNNTNSTLFIFLVSLISLLTISSCLTHSTFKVASVSRTLTATQILTTTSDQSDEHHGTVKGKITDAERIADICDKYCPFENIGARSSRKMYFALPQILTSLLTHSSEFLNSSHLVPAAHIRI